MSHVLEAMHVPVEYAMGTIRFSTGYMTTESEIESAVEAIEATINRLAPSGTAGTEVFGDGEEIRLTSTHTVLAVPVNCVRRLLEKILAQLPRPRMQTCWLVPNLPMMPPFID